MMAWHDRKEAILRRTAQHPVVRLGEGDEAEVYALDQDRIIRFFKRHVDPTYIAKRATFYAGLDASILPFAIPSIIEHGIDDEVAYSIEQRIPGSSLADLLPRLEGSARRGRVHGLRRSRDGDPPDRIQWACRVRRGHGRPTYLERHLGDLRP